MANAILERLLDRLYASLVYGPCLSCRPHHSRQRLDLTGLNALQHLTPEEILPRLLDGKGGVELLAKTPPWRGPWEDDAPLSDAERAARRAFQTQERLILKLRDVAEDANDYEQETGENALYLGYPLLHVPAGVEAMGKASPRILAPVALLPVGLVVKRGAKSSVTLAGKGAGVDKVIANFPLLAWLEQQTGRDTSDLFVDEDGSQPWREINELVKLLAESLHLAYPPEFTAANGLDAVPRTEALPDEPRFLDAAVLGLFPLSNQGLLRDLKAMVKGESLSGTVEPFLQAHPAREQAQPAPGRRMRNFAQERFVTLADPCQARAVRLAGNTPLLVIHGPPGTGKSQTITNLIGDHLARGERVLFVCEKRTAMDVVQHRLAHLGLGALCAVVHDPQRDQRDLYMGIRQQLDGLPERKTDPNADSQLQQTDEELQRLHLELSGYRDALAEPPHPGQPGFHDLVGEWINLPASGLDFSDEILGTARWDDLAPAVPALSETLERAHAANLPQNPWAEAAGVLLGEFLSRPVAEWRSRLEALSTPAVGLDETAAEDLPPLEESELLDQASAREELARRFRALDALGATSLRDVWCERSVDTLTQALSDFDALASYHDAVGRQSLDPELASFVVGKPPSALELNQALTALDDYDAASSRWYGFLLGGKKAAARKLAAHYGFKMTSDVSQRLRQFMESVKARVLCQDFLVRTFGLAPGGLLPDAELTVAWMQNRELLRAIRAVKQGTPPGLETFVALALSGPLAEAAEKIDRSARRARKLSEFETGLKQAGLFSTDWLRAQAAAWRSNAPAMPVLTALGEQFESLETVLRFRLAFAQVPAPLQPATTGLVANGAPADTAVPALRKALLAREISARLRGNPFLQQVDAERIDRLFRRYAELENTKRTLVRDVILHRWTNRQRERLLASTGTQLNAAGAALKRRLFTRGERALKLRQMIAQGAQQAGGDPLFDTCPVWMASPATVAQIFPRQPLFDVMIFDEASQCRLEEALPVLTRGQRVVIAGDPMQLPPTRFFESAIADAEPEEAESDQELFEQQQAETEDLLTAALNLDVLQCYLDVHYRSRNDGLIEFSNRSFYDRRLQAIPGHPMNRPQASPIRLIRADGIYLKRGNAKEAQAVCDLVRELLNRPEPPSIGVACFNLTQRDLILDRLEELAEQDPDFARKLEQARARRGAASFEGLFVKNLENVQGDERDHIIISTTFGPDPQGRFRRNFGPLGKSGGGRRLNVLVTRAREMIHVITSIPRSEYAALTPVTAGQTPGGRWLLYAYLQYIEELERRFTDQVQPTDAAPAAPEVRTDDAPHRSPVALGLARQLAQDGRLGSQVPWGNAGFCVDVAVQHPHRSGDMMLGVLCDFNRYVHAQDPVEWELFRTTMLEAQGWTFHRVLSPGLFANPRKLLADLAAAAKAPSQPRQKEPARRIPPSST
jgi:hypothetical protein